MNARVVLRRLLSLPPFPPFFLLSTTFLPSVILSFFEPATDSHLPYLAYIPFHISIRIFILDLLENNSLFHKDQLINYIFFNRHICVPSLSNLNLMFKIITEIFVLISIFLRYKVRDIFAIIIDYK